MIKNLSRKINFQKNKKFILGGLVIAFVLSLGISYCSAPIKNVAKEDMILTIPAMGQLPDLAQAMNDNSTLRTKVKEILSYDETYLFTNYRQVNGLITEIMFLWIGLTPKQITQTHQQVLAENFIRRVYNFPPDEPIAGNPLLEKKPWAGLFNKIKSKILMQGGAHRIYDGVAYYNSNKDIMVIEGNLSPLFATNLSTFIAAQPKEIRKKYVNNYLSFIDSTLGFENLNANERKMLKNLGFI